jgi:hypothetical protein
VLAMVALLLFCGVRLEGVLFHATSDPDHNTTPPTGTLSGSGWHLQGRWGSYLGTPVGPHYFLTARHVGGAVGQPFIFQGVSYPSLAFHDHAGSDLRLVRVCGSFPAHATLYSGSDEVNQTMVVFGRGTRRGEEILTSDGFTGRNHGWRWGIQDGRMRWGQNRVDSVVPGSTVIEGELGELLRASFDADAGPDECHLSTGDSGGGLFLVEQGVWKLAGLNFAVSGPYRLIDEGESFHAALFDEGGLFRRTLGSWLWVPLLPQPQPGALYATRISPHVPWIQSVLTQPDEFELLPVVQSAAAVTGPYIDDPEAIPDPAARMFRMPAPASPKYYRLRACGPLPMLKVRIAGPDVVLSYELAQGQEQDPEGRPADGRGDARLN